jgi:hypothetical protein
MGHIARFNITELIGDMFVSGFTGLLDVLDVSKRRGSMSSPPPCLWGSADTWARG